MIATAPAERFVMYWNCVFAMHRSWTSARAGILALTLGSLFVTNAWSGAIPSPVRPVDRPETERTLVELRLEGGRSMVAPDGRSKVWVYLRDKGRIDLDQLTRRLPEAAAERRALRFDRVRADVHDAPVVDAYVRGLRRLELEVRRVSRWLNAVSVLGTYDQLVLVAELPFVAWLEPVRILRAHPLADPRLEKLDLPRESPPTAPPARVRIGDPLDYGPSFNQMDEIRVPPVHAAGYSGAGVRVAMLDTGYDYTIPAFSLAMDEGRILAQYDFVNDDAEVRNEEGDPGSQHDHGTYTWSALGGYAPGTLIGPAYGASFLLAKTEDLTQEAQVEEDNWVAAAEWADSLGADVLSSSLSYIDWYTYEDMDGDTAPISIAAEIAASRGIVVCVSAGNQGNLDWFYIGAPADADSIIAVGAVDSVNAVAESSSHGPTSDGRIKPEVTARGVETYCAVPAGYPVSYTGVSGTSLSCPLVAGAAALLLEAFPQLSPMDLRKILLQTAGNAATPNNDIGWGRIDVQAAFDSAVTHVDPDPFAETTGLVAHPNPFLSETILRLASTPASSDPRRVDLFDVSGRRVRQLIVAPGEVSVVWNGRSQTGETVAAGVYQARVSGGTSSPVVSIVRIR